MTDRWITHPELPGVYKYQILKLKVESRLPWVLLCPSKNGKDRIADRYQDWHTAFQTAMTIQDIRNRQSGI